MLPTQRTDDATALRIGNTVMGYSSYSTNRKAEATYLRFFLTITESALNNSLKLQTILITTHKRQMFLPNTELPKKMQNNAEKP